MSTNNLQTKSRLLFYVMNAVSSKHLSVYRLYHPAAFRASCRALVSSREGPSCLCPVWFCVGTMNHVTRWSVRHEIPGVPQLQIIIIKYSMSEVTFF